LALKRVPARLATERQRTTRAREARRFPAARSRRTEAGTSATKRLWLRHLLSRSGRPSGASTPAPRPTAGNTNLRRGSHGGGSGLDDPDAGQNQGRPLAHLETSGESPPAPLGTPAIRFSN